MKTPQEINIEVHKTTHEQGERIIADALAECRKETVQECAEAADNTLAQYGWSQLGFVRKEVRAAILAVAEPPVWEHKPNCPTPYRWTKESGWHSILAEGCSLFARPDALFCDGCGAAKPQVNP